MSLTVISPVSRPSASTIGSFSILCRCRIASASRSVVPDGRGDQTLCRHHVRDGQGLVAHEPEVAVRQDPDEPAVLAGDRHARDPVAGHQLERVPNERVRRQRDGLDDHPRLRALDLVDLGHLLCDREVAVHDADAALPRECDRHRRFGHGVHRSGDDRDLQRDPAREARRGRDVVREHGRLGRHEQDVVEGQALFGELRLERRQPLQVETSELQAFQGVEPTNPL